MTLRRLTRWAIVATVAALIVYDVIAEVWGGPGATISETVRDYAGHAEFPFAGGVICGHFWANSDRNWRRVVTIPILLAMATALVVADVLGYRTGYPWAYLLGGGVAGWLLWAQTKS